MNTSYQGTTEKGTDVWLTPPKYIKALGEFDLDPASSINRPWDTAKIHYTVIDNGLIQPWFGRVWLNPPYARKGMDQWLKLMCKHGNGCALVFASTEVAWFKYIWAADALLFKEGRICFYDAEGNLPKDKKGNEQSSGKGSVFAAYGFGNALALKHANVEGLITGQYIQLK